MTRETEPITYNIQMFTLSFCSMSWSWIGPFNTFACHLDNSEELGNDYTNSQGLVSVSSSVGHIVH